MATTEELLQAQAQAATPAAATPTVSSPTTTALNQQFAQYKGQGYDGINAMYDAQKQANLTNLQNTYQQKLSTAQAARDKLPQTYQAQANDLAVQYERNRRNLNEQAAARGMNTGTASQQQLALNNVWNRDYGNLRTAQANAIAEADRGIADLGIEYQNNIRAAVADNDYRRAAALLDEYNTQYTRNLNDAKTKAAYGDFSGYASIYGQESANAMRNTWISQNPDIAYRTGAIDANRYRALTGKWPAGYSAPSSGGGGGLTAKDLERAAAQMKAEGESNAVINSFIGRAADDYNASASAVRSIRTNVGTTVKGSQASSGGNARKPR